MIITYGPIIVASVALIVALLTHHLTVRRESRKVLLESLQKLYLPPMPKVFQLLAIYSNRKSYSAGTQVVQDNGLLNEVMKIIHDNLMYARPKLLQAITVKQSRAGTLEFLEEKRWYDKLISILRLDLFNGLSLSENASGLRGLFGFRDHLQITIYDINIIHAYLSESYEQGRKLNAMDKATLLSLNEYVILSFLWLQISKINSDCISAAQVLTLKRYLNSKEVSKARMKKIRRTFQTDSLSELKEKLLKYVNKDEQRDFSLSFDFYFLGSKGNDNGSMDFKNDEKEEYTHLDKWVLYKKHQFEKRDEIKRNIDRALGNITEVMTREGQSFLFEFNEAEGCWKITLNGISGQFDYNGLRDTIEFHYIKHANIYIFDPEILDSVEEFERAIMDWLDLNFSIT